MHIDLDLPSLPKDLSPLDLQRMVVYPWTWAYSVYPWTCTGPTQSTHGPVLDLPSLPVDLYWTYPVYPWTCTGPTLSTQWTCTGPTQSTHGPELDLPSLPMNLSPLDLQGTVVYLLFIFLEVLHSGRQVILQPL